MKARIDNGQIVIVSELPNKFRNTIGGYNKLSESVHRADGWFDVIVPSYNPVLQRLGEIYFSGDAFTYPVIDQVFNIETEKQRKINQAKVQANDLLRKTDWYVIRQAERGISIPEEIITQRTAIVTRCEEIETEINGLTGIENVLTYQIILLETNN